MAVKLEVLCVTCDIAMEDVTLPHMAVSVFFCRKCRRVVQVSINTTPVR